MAWPEKTATVLADLHGLSTKLEVAGWLDHRTLKVQQRLMKIVGWWMQQKAEDVNRPFAVISRPEAAARLETVRLSCCCMRPMNSTCGGLLL